MTYFRTDIYYIFYQLYNICTGICGGLEGIFLLKDQHFLPPWQQLLAQRISAHARGWAASPPWDPPSPAQIKPNPLFHEGAECLFPFQSHLRVALTRPGAGSRGGAPPPWTLSERGCSRCSAGCSAACCSPATSSLPGTCSWHTLPWPGNQTPARSTKSCHRQVWKTRTKAVSLQNPQKFSFLRYLH